MQYSLPSDFPNFDLIVKQYRIKDSNNIPLSLVPLLYRKGISLSQMDASPVKVAVKYNTALTKKDKVLKKLTIDTGVIETTDMLGLLAKPEVVDVYPVETSMTLMGDFVPLAEMPADYEWPRLRLNSRFKPYATEFKTVTPVGDKMEVFILDSGINLHPDNQAELVNFYSFVANQADNKGHGTAIASLISGDKVGVLAGSSVKLMSCKIFDDTAKITLEQFLELTQQLIAYQKASPKVRIINASWGVAQNQIIDDAFLSLIQAGYVVICAAGNSGTNVADISPAHLGEVITVGSISKDDRISGFSNQAAADDTYVSNHGDNLDLYAPGENITVACDGGYAIAQGTSFSTALTSACAAGLAMLLPSLTAAEVQRMLVVNATKYAILGFPQDYRITQNAISYNVLADGNIRSFYYAGCLSDVNANVKVNLPGLLKGMSLPSDVSITAKINSDTSNGMFSQDANGGIDITYSVQDKYVIDRRIDTAFVDVFINGTNMGQVGIWCWSLAPGVTEETLTQVNTSGPQYDELSAYINGFLEQQRNSGITLNINEYRE